MLEIYKLNGEKFAVPGGYIMPKGYVLRDPELGIMGFKDDKGPYMPGGGRKTLQEILNTGGLTSYELSVWYR